MKDVIVCDQLQCPKCGSHKFWKEDSLEGLYICANPVDSEAFCNEVSGSYCPECKTLRPFSKYGKHMDVYECKICGRVNWPLTDFIREREERRKALEAAIKHSDALIAQFMHKPKEQTDLEAAFSLMYDDDALKDIL